MRRKPGDNRPVSMALSPVLRAPPGHPVPRALTSRFARESVAFGYYVDRWRSPVRQTLRTYSGTLAFNLAPASGFESTAPGAPGVSFLPHQPHTVSDLSPRAWCCRAAANRPEGNPESSQRTFGVPTGYVEG